MNSSAQPDFLVRHPALRSLWGMSHNLSVQEYTEYMQARAQYCQPRMPHLARTIAEKNFGTKLGQFFLRAPWLQTAPHHGFTLNDRMLTIVWLSHLATPLGQPLFIAGCSGVPVSIYTKPGYVFGKTVQRQNLVPARYQSALLAGGTSDWVDLDRLDDEALRAAMIRHRVTRIDHWMESVLSEVLSLWLNRKVVFFSLNEWARQATAQLVREENKSLERLIRNHLHRPLFLSAYQSGKYQKLATWHWNNDSFHDQHGQKMERDALYDALSQGIVHPTSWLMYATYALVHGNCVAGSFSFAEYYPKYQSEWQQLVGPTLPSGTHLVTTGTHPDLVGCSSWDIYKGQAKASSLDRQVILRELLATLA